MYYITHTTKEITNRLSTSVTSLILNVTNLYHTVNQDISLDVNKHEDSTLTYLRKNIDLFKNSFVVNLVQVIVSLVGVLYSSSQHALLRTYMSSVSGNQRIVKYWTSINMNLKSNPEVLKLSNMKVNYPQSQSNRLIWSWKWYISFDGKWNHSRTSNAQSTDEFTTYKYIENDFWKFARPCLHWGSRRQFWKLKSTWMSWHWKYTLHMKSNRKQSYILQSSYRNDNNDKP